MFRQIINIESLDTVDQIVEDKLRAKGIMFADIIEGGSK